MNCTDGSTCQIDRYGVTTCVCPSKCPAIVSPVCGTDGVTYDSFCEFERSTCIDKKNTTFDYDGVCGSDVVEKCKDIECEFGICRLEPKSREAFCDCDTCTEEFNTSICEFDTVSYATRCRQRKRKCEKQNARNNLLR
jgi:coxsackievirus/adenovirus receptor